METITKPEKAKIAPELKESIKTLAEEESQIIVHLHFHVDWFLRIRIWKTTFLQPHQNGDKSALVHAENISFYPNWTVCKAGKNTCTLIFKGLPKECTMFDLIEEIPEPGGFYFTNIKRNKMDVYNLYLT
jgi:hypothetical protein